VAFVADTALRPDSVVQAERDSLARLPYDRRRDDAERNEGELFVRPFGGGEPRRLTTIPGAKRDPVWGPDGKTIAFLWQPGRTKSTTLATVDVATGRVRNLLGRRHVGARELRVGQRAAARPSRRRWAGARRMFRIGSGGGGAREVLAGRRRLSGFAFDRDRAWSRTWRRA
jgi:hypothetical protein